MKRTRPVFRIGDCPVCHGFIYEDEHIHCIIPQTRYSLKEIINQPLEEMSYKRLYQEMLPPKEREFTEYYDVSWRILWIEEFLSISLIPTWDLLQYLKLIINNDKVLEVGAGAGLYAALLKSLGVDIQATDSYQTMKTITHYKEPDGSLFTYTDVEEINAHDAIIKYPADVLLIIWCSNFPTLFDIENFKGNKVIIIGHVNRQIGGCFDPVCIKRSSREYTIMKQWYLKESFYLPSWFGSEEKLFYLERC